MNRSKRRIGNMLMIAMSLVLLYCCGCSKPKTGSKAEDSTFETNNKKVKAGTYTWSEYLDKNSVSIWYEVEYYAECGKDTYPMMVYAFSDGSVLCADLGLTMGELSRMEDSEILEKVKELNGKPSEKWVNDMEKRILSVYTSNFDWEFEEIEDQLYGEYGYELIGEEGLDTGLAFIDEQIGSCPSYVQMIWQGVKEKVRNRIIGVEVGGERHLPTNKMKMEIMCSIRKSLDIPHVKSYGKMIMLLRGKQHPNFLHGNPGWNSKRN